MLGRETGLAAGSLSLGACVFFLSRPRFAVSNFFFLTLFGAQRSPLPSVLFLQSVLSWSCFSRLSRRADFVRSRRRGHCVAPLMNG